jgi:pyroglutamyl-peptidase
VLKKVLVTGFEPFAGSRLNPSGEIVKALPQIEFEGIELVTEILPVEFGKAGNALIEIIERESPKALVMLGQAEGRGEISIERIAINLDDARIPDNGGDQRKNSVIEPDGADGYFSTLPVVDLVAAIKSAGIPAGVSLSAGTFVCNHIFYRAAHYLQGRSVEAGFVHLPLLDEQSEEFPGKPTMSLQDQVRGIRKLIETLK